MKNKYEQDLEKRIDTVETKYSGLQDKVDELDRDEELEEKLKRARAKLGELKDRGEDAWEDVKDKAEEAWKDVEGAFDRLKARFKKD